MGERVVSNHYIPPDFDPKKAPKKCKPQNGQHQLRFMLPMSIRCTCCGDYMFSGTKSNARKELVYNEFYLDEVNVYRIYIHCKSCYSEITIKTDPKNMDYIVEKGATRHFDPFTKLYVDKAIEDKEKLMGITKVKEIESVDTDKEINNFREMERISSNISRLEGFVLEKVERDDAEELRLTEDDNKKIESFEKNKEKVCISPETIDSSRVRSINKKNMWVQDEYDHY